VPVEEGIAQTYADFRERLGASGAPTKEDRS
jgi:hypothetical protein